MDRQTNQPTSDTLPGPRQIGTIRAEAAEPGSPLTTESLVAKASRGLSDEYLPKFVDEIHQYIRQQIINADQKAVFFFGATTALLGFMHKLGASERWLKSIQEWSLLDTVTFVGMVSFATAAITALLVVVPRLPGSKRGLVYFNAVAEHESAAEYAELLLGQAGKALITEKAKHCHTLARVCG